MWPCTQHGGCAGSSSSLLGSLIEEAQANPDLHFTDAVIKRELPLWRKGRWLTGPRLTCETSWFGGADIRGVGDDPWGDTGPAIVAAGCLGRVDQEHSACPAPSRGEERVGVGGMDRDAAWTGSPGSSSPAVAPGALQLGRLGVLHILSHGWRCWGQLLSLPSSCA